MRKNPRPLCVFCGRNEVQPVGAEQQPGEKCATCISDDESEPVGGSELQRLREEAGLTQRQLAEIISGRKVDADGESYLNLNERDVARMEGALVHRSVIDKLRKLLGNERGDIMDNAGISEASMAAQQAQSARSNAAKTRAAFDEIEVDTVAEIAAVDAALDELIAVCTTLPAILQRRREAYWSAVGAARKLDRLTGERTEDDLHPQPFRRNGRAGLPAGVLLDLMFWSETSLVLPVSPDPAELLVQKPEYLNSGATATPIRRTHP